MLHSELSKVSNLFPQKYKKNGEVFTPESIVNIMLNSLDYKGEKILKLHIMDNSSGDGAFLKEILKRYIFEAKKANFSIAKIKKGISTYIHGIELNPVSWVHSLVELKKVLKCNKIPEDIEIDVIQADTLEIWKKYQNKMDIVVGNPPYIRIHDLYENIKYKEFSFSNKGMTDLYLIFFEIGIRMLNNNGELIYISPNSYFSSFAGFEMRKYVYENKMIKKVINLGHFNPFQSVTTYTAIIHLTKKKNEQLSYYKLSNFTEPLFVSDLNYLDFFIDNNFYFAKKADLNWFQSILLAKDSNLFAVKNGVATNLDSFFFNETYNGAFIKKAIKISSMKKTKVFYPYDKNGKLIKLEEIKKKNNSFYNLLKNNYERLNNRSLQGREWYEFARSQAISDTNKNRIIVNNIIKDQESIKLNFVEPGEIVFSGYYIIYKNERLKNKIVEFIKDDEFIKFLKILGKDKNGKYYFYSSNDLKKYLSYKIQN